MTRLEILRGCRDDAIAEYQDRHNISDDEWDSFSDAQQSYYLRDWWALSIGQELKLLEA